jgi:hypothetical protein
MPFVIAANAIETHPQPFDVFTIISPEPQDGKTAAVDWDDPLGKIRTAPGEVILMFPLISISPGAASPAAPDI